MIGLDTSVIVRLLTGEPETLARAARDRIERAGDAGLRVVVCDLAIAEAYHALRHHYGVPGTEARSMLLHLLSSGVVEADPPDTRDALANAAVTGDGPGVVDLMIHARHRRAGAVTLTFDRRQATLEGAERCSG